MGEPSEETIGSSDKNKYFDSYDDITVHELMLRDKSRVLAYKDFIEKNRELFAGKTVLDVGAGTGILSLFSASAGAEHVYAVEASNMAGVCSDIVLQNGLDQRITVLHQPIEEVDVIKDKSIDVIISEWMGFYLLHESMLDSVIFARDKFLAEDGIVLPSCTNLYVAPVEMKNYFSKHFEFWKNVYGFDFSPMIPLSLQKHFNEPVLMAVESSQVLSPPQCILHIDMNTVSVEQVQQVKSELTFTLTKNGYLHGFAAWFDAVFTNGFDSVILSTAPDAAETHWKQTVFFLPTPLLVDSEDNICCSISLTQDEANKRRYDICMEIPADMMENINGTDDVKIDDLVSPENHPLPCDCSALRCTIIKTLMVAQEAEYAAMNEEEKDIDVRSELDATNGIESDGLNSD